MIGFSSSNSESSRVIDLLWQKEVIQCWLSSSRTPEWSREQLRELLNSVEGELANLEHENQSRRA
jgi:hypothetical protein